MCEIPFFRQPDRAKRCWVQTSKNTLLMSRAQLKIFEKSVANIKTTLWLCQDEGKRNFTTDFALLKEDIAFSHGTGISETKPIYLLTC